MWGAAAFVVGLLLMAGAVVWIGVVEEIEAREE